MQLLQTGDAMTDLPNRVASLEGEFNRLSTGFDNLRSEVRSDMASVKDSISQVVEMLNQTSQTAESRAISVRDEMREEQSRKSADRNELLRNGLALLGGVALIVAAFMGPYLSKLNTTSDSATANSREISEMRASMAEIRAKADRNFDFIVGQRDVNRKQDNELIDLEKNVARLQGVTGEAR